MLNQTYNYLGNDDGWNFQFSAYQIYEDDQFGENAVITYSFFFDNGDSARFTVHIIVDNDEHDGDLQLELSEHEHQMEHFYMVNNEYHSIDSLRDLDVVVRDIDLFYVISLDDAEDDFDLEVHPTAGQTVGVLAFSKNHNTRIELETTDLDAAQDSKVRIVSGYDWSLVEQGVSYWFVNFAVSRNVTQHENDYRFGVGVDRGEPDDMTTEDLMNAHEKTFFTATIIFKFDSEF